MWILAYYKLLSTDITSKNYPVEGHDHKAINMRGCKYCGLIKRNDMHHCFECGTCVEGFDHHCGVVGICIGDPNIKYFFNFLAYTGLIFVFYGIAMMMITETDRDHNGEEDTNPLFSCLIIGAFLILFGGSFVAMGSIFIKQALFPEMTKRELEEIEIAKNSGFLN